MAGARGDGDDQELVRRCLAGDEDAWRRLVDAHRPRMIDLARRILPSNAIDVVDAVIADLWQRRKLEQYEGRSTLKTWLGAVAINAALNARRAAQASGRAAAGDIPEPRVAPRVEDDRPALARILTEAIGALPSDDRLLVLMYYEQGVTLDAAAVVFGRSKSTLSRALASARERIAIEADRLAQLRFNVTLAELRAGADLAELDVDLRSACAPVRDEIDHGVSKS